MGRAVQAGSVAGKTEGDFRAELVKKLRATTVRGYRPLVVPVETGSTMLGVSDLFLRTSRISVWMELKRLRGDVADAESLVVPFRPGQIQFLRRFYELGGVSALGIATPKEVLYFVNSSIQERYEPPYAGLRILRQSRIGANELLVWLESEAERS